MARATTAAPGIFPLVKMEGQVFVDGSFGTNNPALSGYTEAATMQPKSSTCLISIGSGHRSSSSGFGFGGNLGQLLAYIGSAIGMSTDTARAHEQLEALAGSNPTQLTYFRFDVPGLENIPIDEWTSKRRAGAPEFGNMHTLAFIELRTNEYLGRPEVIKAIHNAALAVVNTRRILL